jgi:hypothetical protein
MQLQCNSSKNYNDDVSMKLVYVGWDFGDCHYDNSIIIPNYNLS